MWIRGGVRSRKSGGNAHFAERGAGECASFIDISRKGACMSNSDLEEAHLGNLYVKKPMDTPRCSGLLLERVGGLNLFPLLLPIGLEKR